MFKTLTATTLLAATALAGAPVQASSGHQALWDAVESVGIEIRVNQASDCDPEANGLGRQVYGWYHGPSRALVVCQEAAMASGRWDQGQLGWSAEDLDTLRHEAHHLVQDCRDESLNQTLHAVYKDPIALAVKWLGNSAAHDVVEAYKERGEHIQVMELEAFAVAAMNDPREQVRDIQTFCF